MQYKSLYRKYRPMEFKDVVGQNHIIKTLKNSIKENKISHAYLFSGTRGTGKTSVAKIFAKTINCFNLKEDEICNECFICKNINTDEIQDIIEIDAASNNGVDEIRELKSKINLVPTMCKYKVYIIDEVHMLSIGAFNALLKTLEEPPSHAIFILATTEPQKLPITIISRCQRYDFKKLSVIEIQERLNYICDNEKIKIDDISLEEISKISDGSMRDAIGILEQASSYTNKKIRIDDIYEIIGGLPGKQISKIIEMIYTKDAENIIDLIEKSKNEGKDFYRLAEDMLFFLRNILINKRAPKYFEKKEILNKDLVIELSKKIDEKTTLFIIKELNELITEMKKSTHITILFELFIFKVLAEEETKSSQKIVLEDDLVEKKENLENIKEKTIEKDEKNSKEYVSIINDYKEAYINNTLFLAKKENLKDIQDKWKQLQTFLINKKYKDCATILLDSKIRAVSDKNILITYKYDCMVETHDKETKKIQSLLKELLSSKYITIAITEDYWEEIRPKYVSLKKSNKMELKEEKDFIVFEEKIEELIPNPLIDNAINVFGEDIIEMEG